MAVERTYIMLKPDCVRRGLMGRVISRIEDKGYKSVDAKMMHLTSEKLREHKKLPYLLFKKNWKKNEARLKKPLKTFVKN